VTFQPQWIEAPTENLGYERSLWRQLWEWLDRLMLGIENWIISIYQRLKGEL
jgi:ABC-type dipeptide/oligopeptide/nickel transport system permease component